MEKGIPTIYTSEDRLRISAPCQYICPIDTKAPTYVSLINRNRFKEAWDIIRLDNPLPSACARVCHHPCETQCQAVKWGDPIAIRVLKRVATDYVLKEGIYLDPPRNRNPDKEEVAVVGAGPSGLAAANELAKKGYDVTIFEALEAPGGAMAACIPEYRLPNTILNLDIENIKNQGVKIVLNTKIGRDIPFEEIRKTHRAVYLATGCHRSNSLRIPDEDAEGVLYSMEFLNDRNLGRNQIKIGRRVGVIGGGNAAMDAARVAIRQSECEKVTLIYRRTRAEMPAFEEEVDAAFEEGIDMRILTTPAGIVTENGKMVGVKCIKMELGEPDDSGRRRPVPIEGSEFIVDLDTLIIAIGESADLSYLGDRSGLELNPWGTVVADESLGTTNVEGVFAGGDAVTGPRTVIDAIAAGKIAAESIDRYLQGKEIAREHVLPPTTMFMRNQSKLVWR